MVRVTPVIECRLRLDGGAMFGVVPRPVWSRTFAPDDRNRVSLVCRVLLVEGDGMVAIVDAGMGEAWTDDERDRFGLEAGGGIEAALALSGRTADDVTDVFLTHLHFDHAGGIARADGSPRFGRAIHHVPGRNRAWAERPTDKDRGSYRPQTLAVLDRVRVQPCDGDTELRPGVRTTVSNGHTEGLQIVWLATADGPVVFAADLVPTRAHVHLPWIMAYDNHPLRMLEEKQALFEALETADARLVLEHDPEVEAIRVRREQGRWAWRPATLTS